MNTIFIALCWLISFAWGFNGTYYGVENSTKIGVTVRYINDSFIYGRAEMTAMLPYGDASFSCPAVRYSLAANGTMDLPELKDFFACAGAVTAAFITLKGLSAVDIAFQYDEVNDLINITVKGEQALLLTVAPEPAPTPAPARCRVVKANPKGIKVDSAKCEGKTAEECRANIMCAPDYVYGKAQVFCETDDGEFEFFGCNNRPNICMVDASFCDNDADCCSGECTSKKAKDGVLVAACRPLSKAKLNPKHISYGAAGGFGLGLGLTTIVVMSKRRKKARPTVQTAAAPAAAEWNGPRVAQTTVV